MARKQRPQARPRKSSSKPTPKRLLGFLDRSDYNPLPFNELMDEMGISGRQYHENARSILNGLIEGGKVRLKDGCYESAGASDLLEGTISFARSGNAFVSVAGYEEDIFINEKDTHTALPGDRVKLRLKSGRVPKGERQEGVVVELVKRENLTIVGTLKRIRRKHVVQPLQSSISQMIEVEHIQNAMLDDRVLVKLLKWDDPREAPRGKIVEVIGPADDPAFDTLAVMKAHNLPESFAKATVTEAEQVSITDREIAKRLDLREEFIFTIDPATARDFDDAISLTREDNGIWKLGVHIADVSHFVKPGTSLDSEALDRATSVYLPDLVIPMLPEQLSNGLCSLNPHVDRLAMTAFIYLNDRADVVDYSFHETVIHSKLRLTYEQAMEIIELKPGKAYLPAKVSADHVKLIHQIHKLTMKIRKKRFRDGSLNLDIPEVRFVIGEDGSIMGIEKTENDESHQLIEECMLLANEVVCKSLCDAEVPHIHRIHDKPDIEKLEELTGVLTEAGVHVGDLSRRKNLIRLLEEIQDYPQAYVWNSAILRSMKKAEYAVKGIGHFGLAKEHYTHFTSPIRRYPDLVVHRILRSRIQKKKLPYNVKILDEMSVQSSDREMRAMTAERDVIDLKRLRFFAEQLESGDLIEFDAITVEVRHFGAFVFIPDVQAYGLISVKHIEADYFDYNSRRNELQGKASGLVIGIGTNLKVVVSKVDMDKKQLDFVLSDFNPGKGGKNRHQRRRAQGKKGGSAKGGEKNKKGGRPRKKRR